MGRAGPEFYRQREGLGLAWAFSSTCCLPGGGEWVPGRSTPITQKKVLGRFRFALCCVTNFEEHAVGYSLHYES